LTIKRKNTLTGDAYSRPPISIKSHDLHVDDIKGTMGDIPREGLALSLFFCHLLAFSWPSLLVSFVMVPTINLFIGFLLFIESDVI
jgi:hypothetical protein